MKNYRLWIQILVAVALFTAAIQFFSRAPDFEVFWDRSVPSYLSRDDLVLAMKDTRNWPVFHHELKEAQLFRVVGETETPVKEFDGVEPGMHVTFKMEPKAKEWKRYEIRAKVLSVNPGQSIAFRLLPESQGKVTKILGNYEWSFSVIDATEKMKARGYLSAVSGDAKASTLTGKARFFGRVAAKILMNQTYPVDLARLANFEENKEARAGDYAPVYK